MELGEQIRFRKVMLNRVNQQKLSQFLRRNTTLKCLDFSGTDLTDSAVEALCSCLRQNQVLVNVRFTKSSFTSVGLSRIFVALSTNDILTDISVSHSVCTDGVLDQLCQFISENKTMECLNAGESKLTDAKLSELMAALRKNHTVSHLQIDQSLPSCHVQPLASFIQMSTDLERIKYMVKGEKHYIDVIHCGHSLSSYYCVKTVWGTQKVQPLLEGELTDLELSPWQPRPSLRKTSVAKSNPVFPKKKDSTEDEGPKRPTERRKPTRRRSISLPGEGGLVSTSIPRAHFGESSGYESTIMDDSLPDQTQQGRKSWCDAELDVFHPPSLSGVALSTGFIGHRDAVRSPSIGRNQMDYGVSSMEDETPKRLRRKPDPVDRTPNTKLSPSVVSARGEKKEPHNPGTEDEEPKRIPQDKRLSAHHRERGYHDQPSEEERNNKPVLPAERLRQEIKEIRVKFSLSSALDIMDKKLVLFVPQEIAAEVKQSLRDTVTDSFKNEYKLHLVEKSLILKEENGPKKGNPGNKIYYTDSDNGRHFATCGAFVKDDDDKLYILSSCHGHSPKQCYFLEPVPEPREYNRHPCRLAASVYQKDPLVDAVLLEVYTDDLKSIVEPVPQKDQPKSHALCGMYDDYIEDLVHADADEVTVMKYEGKTSPTKGKLSFYKFQNPSDEITDALVITPADPEQGSFSSEGDSGSVVVLEKTHEHPGKHRDYSLHLGLAMLCYGIEGLHPGVKCSLAFKLEHAINALECKIGKELNLLPFDHNED